MRPSANSNEPTVLTAEWVRESYERLESRVSAVELDDGPDGWLSLFADWKVLMGHFDGEESRTLHTFSQDLRNADSENAQRTIREEVMPVAQRGDNALCDALLRSRHADAVGDRYGVQLLRVLRVKQSNLAAINSDLRIEEGALITRYDMLVASGELHSMAMEFLCLPYLAEFFSQEQLRTLARNRWRQSVRLIPWVTLADAFRHWVYESPSATQADREAEFVRLYSEYQPRVDWSGDAAPYAATKWYRIPHLFRHLSYMIDYALDETSAIQLAMLDARDHDQCMETYLELCRLGGSDSLTGLLHRSNLRPPIDASLLEELTSHAQGQLA